MEEGKELRLTKIVALIFVAVLIFLGAFVVIHGGRSHHDLPSANPRVRTHGPVYGGLPTFALREDGLGTNRVPATSTPQAALTTSRILRNARQHASSHAETTAPSRSPVRSQIASTTTPTKTTTRPKTSTTSTTSTLPRATRTSTTTTTSVPTTSSTSTTTSTTTTSPPVASSLRIVDTNGTPGSADLGDQIIVTYATPPSPHSFCSSWSATSYPDLVNSNVVVTGAIALSGHDQLTVTDGADCAGGFHFGSIDLGEGGFFTAADNFGGLVVIGADQCAGGVTTGCTRIHWNGRNTLTITLGAPALPSPTQTTPAIATYALDPALGGGTILSSKAIEF